MMTPLIGTARTAYLDSPLRSPVTAEATRPSLQLISRESLPVPVETSQSRPTESLLPLHAATKVYRAEWNGTCNRREMVMAQMSGLIETSDV